MFNDRGKHLTVSLGISIYLLKYVSYIDTKTTGSSVNFGSRVHILYRQIIIFNIIYVVCANYYYIIYNNICYLVSKWLQQ